MLARHLVGYIPANVVPAIASFCGVYFFTRLVSPAEYGVYTLALTLSVAGQALFFYWLQTGALRFHARAEVDESMQKLRGTIYSGFWYCAAVVTLLALAAIYLFVDSSGTRHALLIGLGLVLIKSIVSINQAFNRSAMRVRRYNFIECVQSVLGLGLAVVLTQRTNGGASTILTGLVVGAAVTCLVDVRTLWRGVGYSSDRKLMRSLIAYGLPLTACYGLGYVLNAADRVMIEYFLGPGPVGIYSVAVNTMDRTIASICAGISMAAFPLLVSAHETRGADAARQQYSANGIMFLGLTLPACAGLIVTTPQLTQVFIGPAFREGAMQIMPWAVLTSFMSGLQVHYVAHSFHLAKRTTLLALSIAPAALLNIALNAILLPRIGLMGGIYASLASSALALFTTIWLSRTVFAFDFPWRAAWKIALASGVMAATVHWLDFSQVWTGLIAALCTGMAVYSGIAWALDIGGVRRHFSERRYTRTPWSENEKKCSDLRH